MYSKAHCGNFNTTLFFLLEHLFETSSGKLNVNEHHDTQSASSVVFHLHV